MAGWEAVALLASRVAALDDLDDLDPDIRSRALALAHRVEAREFYVAVVGEFKRGKSTLVNALFGTAALPTGTVPLTSVPTEVVVGRPGVMVWFSDGRRLEIATDQLEAFATERGNPSNGLGVARLRVAVDSPFGVPGLVVVDTPGLGSTIRENSAEAERALATADAFVVVLSADAPVSDIEQRLLERLSAQGNPVFVVVNRVDHLEPPDVDELRSYVGTMVARTFGRPTDLFLVSARAVLTGSEGPGAVGFATFSDHLQSYLRYDLERARYEAAVTELRRLGDALDISLSVTEAAANLERGALEERLASFEAAVADGERLLAEDRILLRADVEHLVGDVVDALGQRAKAAVAARRGELVAVARSAPLGELDHELRSVVQLIVEQTFEPTWTGARARSDLEWGETAGRFTDRARDRVVRLRQITADLFDARMPVLDVPAVGSLPSSFTYYFLHVEGPTAVVGRLGRRLLPPKLVRRRALQLAERQLAEAIDRHVGRARYDLTERLRTASQVLVERQTSALASVGAAVVGAASRARRELASTVQGERDRAAGLDEARHVVEAIAALDDVRAVHVRSGDLPPSRR